MTLICLRNRGGREKKKLNKTEEGVLTSCQELEDVYLFMLFMGKPFRGNNPGHLAKE